MEKKKKKKKPGWIYLPRGGGNPQKAPGLAPPKAFREKGSFIPIFQKLGAPQGPGLGVSSQKPQVGFSHQEFFFEKKNPPPPKKGPPKRGGQCKPPPKGGGGGRKRPQVKRKGAPFPPKKKKKISLLTFWETPWVVLFFAVGKGGKKFRVKKGNFFLF